jgi:hypothetical protein
MVNFPSDCLTAFNALKQALYSEPIVDYPRKNRPYSLIVDACTGTIKQLVEWVHFFVEQINKENN